LRPFCFKNSRTSERKFLKKLGLTYYVKTTIRPKIKAVALTFLVKF